MMDPLVPALPACVGFFAGGQQFHQHSRISWDKHSDFIKIWMVNLLRRSVHQISDMYVVVWAGQKYLRLASWYSLPLARNAEEY